MPNRLLTIDEALSLFPDKSTPSRNYTDAQIDELAYDLQGTCQSLEEAVQKTDRKAELTTADCGALDQLVFLCNQCSWWDELGQESIREPGVCIDCEPGEEDDD